MKNTIELINDLNDLDAVVRRDAARKFHFRKSFSAIFPIIQALEVENDLVVKKPSSALEAISLHWTDPEEMSPDVIEEKLDVSDPAQVQ